MTLRLEPQRFDLVLTLVRRELVLRYRRSVLGMAWSQVGPLALLGVLAFAFGPTVERKVFGKTPPGVTQLSSIDQLRTDFNRDAGSTRLVMIFSPT